MSSTWRFRRLRTTVSFLLYLLLLGSSRETSAGTVEESTNFPIVPPFCALQQIPQAGSGNLYSPSLNADGTRIAFAAAEFIKQNRNYKVGFFLFDTITGILTPIASSSQLRLRLSPLKISADGRWIVLSSAETAAWGVAGSNPGIFLFDTIASTLTQLIDSGGNVLNGFASSLSADGTRITLSSTTNQTGNNPDGNDEIFLFDTTSHTLTQITNTTGFFPNLSPSISTDGTRVVFSSTADLTGNNTDHNVEIFLFDTITNTLTQITDTVGSETNPNNNFSPALNADGSRIVFESRANFTGENADENTELFLFDTHTGTFTQITHTAGSFSSFDATLSDDGTRIVFAADADLLGKIPSAQDNNDPNASLASAIFLFDTTTHTFTQLTQNGTSYFPAISTDATRIAFTFAPKVVLVGADLLGYDPADSSSGLFLASCSLPSAHSSPIMAAIENPEPGPVSGIAVVRGWAFSTQSGVQIKKVDLLIDDAPIGDLPCCSERSDVQTAFPQFPLFNTRNSGWGTILNWGVLSPGPHTARARIRSTSGEIFVTEPRTVTVVKPGDFEFLDQFSLSRATAWIAGDELILEGVEVRDKGTQQQKQVDIHYRWFTSSQSLQAVETLTTATLSSSRSFFAAVFAALAKRFIELPISTIAQAASSIVQGFESPEEDQVVSGMGLIRGWTFTDMPSTTLKEVRLLIDGTPGSLVPCCTQRKDVAASYPDNPNALSSGWGLAFNYGILPAGPHIIGMQIEDSTGAVLGLDHNITVVKVGDSEFLDQFDLSEATARIVRVHPWSAREEISIDGVRVRDKVSQESRVVTVRLRWFQSSQALGIVASTDESNS